MVQINQLLKLMHRISTTNVHFIQGRQQDCQVIEAADSVWKVGMSCTVMEVNRSTMAAQTPCQGLVNPNNHSGSHRGTGRLEGDAGKYKT